MMLEDPPRCDHESSTLVQHTFRLMNFDEEGHVISLEEKENWFVCWQCDLCGAITQKPVTAEEVANGNSLPWLDEDNYDRRTKERMVGQTEWVCLTFMNVATMPQRRSYR